MLRSRKLSRRAPRSSRPRWKPTRLRGITLAAKGKMNWAQRQELHHILDWTRQPVRTPVEMMMKFAVRCWLDGKDPEPLLLAKGIQPFVLRIAMIKARVFIGNERGKRRNIAAQILES